MKRKKLTYEELDKVIKLKKLGTSWLRIERETGISRRTAKRVYEEWEHSQSPEVLMEARRDVAAQEFRKHMSSLITLAGSLVTNLSVPSSIDDMEKNTGQFFSELWHQDLLLRWTYIPSETREYYLMSQEHKRDMQFNFLENELLFKCLQDHTRGEGVRWEALEEWKKARDNCAKIVPKLRKERSVAVNNFLKQEQETNFLQRIKEEETNFLQRIKEEEETQHNPVDEMAKAVLNAVWQGVVEDKLGQDLVRMVSPRSGGQGIVKVKDETFLIFNDMSLAEKVIHICNLVVNNLSKGDMVEQLQREVRTMEKATEEFGQMLNPVRLTPMILRTRCDLCPA